MSGPQSDDRTGERSLKATGAEGKEGRRGARILFQGALLLILCALVCYGDDGFALPSSVSSLDAPVGSLAGMGPLLVLCVVALAAASRTRKEAPRGRLGAATFLLLLIATLTAARGMFLARSALPMAWLDLYGILPGIVSALALSVTCSIGFGVLCIGALAAVSGFADPTTSVWSWEYAYLTAGAGMPALFLGSMAHTRKGLVFAAAAGGLGLALANVAQRIVVEGWEPLKGGPVPEGLATSVAGISVGLLGAAIVLVFMPAIEPLLGKTSNLTIAGLLRLDHPVLLWIRENAPGTYHHSLNVGTLAASAAQSVGANPLLAQAAG
ncbi:MAG: hypothetical protein O6952_07180, partial [Planctomycetota bacterium]|nr:hypothetical protein [Planctomycetota bacterium]